MRAGCVTRVSAVNRHNFWAKDAAFIQIAQMPVVDATLVKEDDFTALDPGAQFARPLVVVLAGGVDDHEVGQQTLQVQGSSA